MTSKPVCPKCRKDSLVLEDYFDEVVYDEDRFKLECPHCGCTPTGVSSRIYMPQDQIISVKCPSCRKKSRIMISSTDNSVDIWC